MRAKQSDAAPSVAWTQQLLLFSLFFAGLMLLHAPLLRLPYFWDEAGYYIPAARDLYLTGSLIPHSTPSNAHPPLVMATLAAAWRVAGYSPLVTRTMMLAFAAFALLGIWRLAREAANPAVAWGTTGLVAIYPVFFAQSSMAHLDLAAAAFTFWGLVGYVKSRRIETVLWFSFAALAKETAILAPLALFGWGVLAGFLPRRWKEIDLPAESRILGTILLFPILPLAIWYAYHYAKTGFLLGNPEFVRYNVAATVNWLRIPFAMGIRLWHLFGYFGLWLLTASAILAMRRAPVSDNTGVRDRIPVWIQIAFLSVILAYLGFMSAIGGAVLARYMLPVVPLVLLVLVSTVWRRLRYWRLLIAMIALIFVAGLFTNPPYGFSPEDNLAYRDYVVMHAEASRFMALRYPQARVLSAWPASDELSRPWLGYVARPFPVVRLEDFTEAQVAVAAAARDRFDVVFAFSTKYQPAHPLIEDWPAWQRLKEKFFGFHRDLSPEEISQQLGGRITFEKKTDGQWVAVITIERQKNALMSPP